MGLLRKSSPSSIVNRAAATAAAAIALCGGCGREASAFRAPSRTPSPSSSLSHRYSSASAFLSLPLSSIVVDRHRTTTIMAASSSSSSPRFNSSELRAASLEVDAASSTTEGAVTFGSDEDLTRGEVIQYYRDGTYVAGRGGAGYAVVRVQDEDYDEVEALLNVANGNAKNGEVEKVELADALFGKPTPAEVKAVVDAKTKNLNGGVIADGDLTGRTVTFSDKRTGLVVAHRHPVAFVLIDADDKDGGGATDAVKSCTVSRGLAKIDAPSVPPGSVVDFRGKHVRVSPVDGSVCAALPLPRSGGNDGIAAIGMFSLGATSIADERSIFAAIPKISDIGLIDSPLVTGVTAVDALTPIGKGQNMLVVGREGGGMKRCLVMDMLQHVVETERKRSEKRKAAAGEGESDAATTVRCYYGSTSADPMVRADVVSRLERAGIANDVVTVVSTRDSNGNAGDAGDSGALNAAEAVAVAASAIALGEHHALSTGGDSLIVIDDIELHKALWDATTQSLVGVYGTDAVVKADLTGGSSSEMRGYFSGLIQRAARFNKKRGGGSVTLLLLTTLLDGSDASDDEAAGADDTIFDPSDFEHMSDKIQTRIAMLVKAKVPLTRTNLRKIEIPLPRPSASADARRLNFQHVDDLISMSDGQVWLDDELPYAKGMRPPLDATRSIARVGVGADTMNCRADAPALRTVVGSLRFEFAQASDILNSKAEGAETDQSSSSRQTRRRDAFLLAMHQEAGKSRKLSDECIVLLAASSGSFDKVVKEGGRAGSAAGSKVVEGLIAHVRAAAGDVVEEIDDTLDMSADGKITLEDSIASFFTDN